MVRYIYCNKVQVLTGPLTGSAKLKGYRDSIEYVNIHTEALDALTAACTKPAVKAWKDKIAAWSVNPHNKDVEDPFVEPNTCKLCICPLHL